MAAPSNNESRGEWRSSFGFIMAAAGSAVGLGNIWRFPYITGQNGGGAFVFVYILCVFLIGLPLLMNEVALGRLTRKNPIGAMRVSSNKKFWLLPGILSVVICFMVLTYYSVIAGWTVGYIVTEVINIPVNFAEFIQTPMYIIPLTAVFMALTIFVVLGGVSGGIEKASRLLMPLLFILILAISIRTLLLPGAMEGVKYYLNPDFSKINGKVILAALGQAFFSLSVGWGLMVTYGSYLSRKDNIVVSGIWIAGMDTAVALLGGLMVFPAVFAFGMSPSAGPALVFEVLPSVFDQIPFGNIIGGMFFLLLMVAALTSSISMLEVPVSYLIDEKKFSRKKAAWLVGGGAMVLAIPSILSAIDGSIFKTMSLKFFSIELVGWFNMMDWIFGTFAVTMLCFLLSLFAGWFFKTEKLTEELNYGSGTFFEKSYLFLGFTPAQIWVFLIRYVCPIFIGMVLLDLFGVFGTAASGG
jgi:NSS family neurotransmitter:Na+ symporter